MRWNSTNYLKKQAQTHGICLTKYVKFRLDCFEFKLELELQTFCLQHGEAAVPVGSGLGSALQGWAPGV